MDSSLIWIFVLIAVVVVLLIARPLLKRWAREKGAERNADRAANKKQSQTGPDGLGATLLLSTDVETARSIVAPLVESRKRVKAQEDGTWAKTHYNDDDIVYAVTQALSGTVVSVTRAIEFAGTVNGVKEWQTLREDITRVASERGISVSTGGDQLVSSAPLVPNGPQVWVRPTA